jgi:hypothetical protein
MEGPTPGQHAGVRRATHSHLVASSFPDGTLTCSARLALRLSLVNPTRKSFALTNLPLEGTGH